MTDDVLKKLTEMIAANQAYGSGTMIGGWPTRILKRCPDRTEAYITATLNLKRIRHARSHSRNFEQRRPELYHDLIAPVDQRPGRGDSHAATTP